METHWRIGDTAIALFDIFLEYRDEKGKRTVIKIVEKDSEHTVRDVKTFDCMQLMNIEVKTESKDIIVYSCQDCRAHHRAKKAEEKVIFFPGIWFIKPEMNSRKESIKDELIKNGKGPSPLKIHRSPATKTPPKEIPGRIHEKERTKETVSSCSEKKP